MQGFPVDIWPETNLFGGLNYSEFFEFLVQYLPGPSTNYQGPEKLARRCQLMLTSHIKGFENPPNSVNILG